MQSDETVNHFSKVSVYMPAFNAEGTIKDALDSIIAQSYKNIEITVIDDGSTDNTKNILLDYTKKNLIKLITHKNNLGIQDTYNEIYSIVESKFFCIYHADDTYEPNIVEYEVNVLKNNTNVSAVFSLSSSNLNVVPNELKNEKLDYIIFDKKKLFLLLMKYYNFIACPTACFRTDIVKKIGIKWGNLDVKPKLVQGHSGEDLQMWLELVEKNPIAIIPRPLFHWRKHADQMSNTVKSGLKTTSDFIHVMEYHIDKNYVTDIPKNTTRDFNFIRYKEFNIAALNSILLNDNKKYRENILNAKKCVKGYGIDFIFDSWIRRKYVKFFILHNIIIISYFFNNKITLEVINKKYFLEY